MRRGAPLGAVLLHLDVGRAGRPGFGYVHVAADERGLLAYVECHDGATAASIAAFAERALAVFVASGVTVGAVVVDSAALYLDNAELAAVLARAGLRLLRSDPYTVRKRGVERLLHALTRSSSASPTRRPSRGLLLRRWRGCGGRAR